MLLDCLEGVFRLIPHGYAENFEAFVGIFVVEFLDYGSLADAGTAPACPEVNEGVFAFTDVVAQTRGLAIVGDFEILEHVAGLGFLLLDEACAKLGNAFAFRECGVEGQNGVELRKIAFIGTLEESIIAEGIVVVGSNKRVGHGSVAVGELFGTGHAGGVVGELTVFFHQGFLGFVEAGKGFIQRRARHGASFRIKNNLAGLENYCSGT